MDGFVGWLHPLRFLHECNPSYGGLTFTPMGLTLIEHASLLLDALWSKNSCSASVVLEQASEAPIAGSGSHFQMCGTVQWTPEPSDYPAS